MSDETLIIKLNQTIVGYLTHHHDGKNVFVFDDAYANDESGLRPVLSMSFRDFTQPIVIRNRLPEFFSNLLPEGDLCTLISSQLNIRAHDEFALLSALGNDLPGAIIAEKQNAKMTHAEIKNNTLKEKQDEENLHFSLAGVQIKFSMLKEKSWFTLTNNALPGDYIVKTPSLIYPNLPENEYSMMTLAREIGIDTPDVQLVLLTSLKNLPPINLPKEKYAYAVKRFDRNNGSRIHIEDFAQVFNVPPLKKYEATNYDTMMNLIHTRLPNPEAETREFLRRLFFMILIGNTDAHLKNWSLIYRDGITPSLAPVYDLVSTLFYLKNNRTLALNFAKQKKFYAINEETLHYFAKRTGISKTLIQTVAIETVNRFKKAWQEHSPHLPISAQLMEVLQTYWKQLPLYHFAD